METTKILQKDDCTEYLLQQKLRAFRSNPHYIAENLYVFRWESDMLIKTKSGYWYEVECKISLADFKHDFTKEEKHTILQRGWMECGSWKITKRPNYFSYCVPWYLEEKVTPLIPDYAGLVVLKQNGSLHEVKKPPLLHKEKYKDSDFNLAEKFYYNWRKEVELREHNSQWEYIKKLRGEIDLLKAEYKAATGVDFDEYIKDTL